MATQLDLQEQEQLDAIKAFWKQYGNLVTWVLIALLAAYAAYNGYAWWQRDQAAKAGTMFDEVERAALAGDADRVGRVFGDLKDRFPRTAYAAHAGLLAARAQHDTGHADAASTTLAWVGEHAVEAELRTVARLRLAALQAEAKDYAAALKTLDAADADAFAGLVADRRGDVLALQGQADAAKAAYQQAWQALPADDDYRRIVDAKLTALGAAPAASAASATVAGRQP